MMSGVMSGVMLRFGDPALEKGLRLPGSEE